MVEQVSAVVIVGGIGIFPLVAVQLLQLVGVVTVAPVTVGQVLAAVHLAMVV